MTLEPTTLASRNSLNSVTGQPSRFVSTRLLPDTARSIHRAIEGTIENPVARLTKGPIIRSPPWHGTARIARDTDVFQLTAQAIPFLLRAFGALAQVIDFMGVLIGVVARRSPQHATFMTRSRNLYKYGILDHPFSKMNGEVGTR